MGKQECAVLFGHSDTVVFPRLKQQMCIRDRRDAIGYVPQKGVLFSGDISSNLRYGGEDADADVLRRAAEVAQATEFIDELPDGFETAISQGGTNVSGGQRQRLSIARALEMCIRDRFTPSTSRISTAAPSTLSPAVIRATTSARVFLPSTALLR